MFLLPVPFRVSCGEIVNPSVETLKGLTKEGPVGAMPPHKNNCFTFPGHHSKTVMCKMHMH